MPHSEKIKTNQLLNELYEASKIESADLVAFLIRAQLIDDCSASGDQTLEYFLKELADAKNVLHLDSAEEYSQKNVAALLYLRALRSQENNNPWFLTTKCTEIFDANNIHENDARALLSQESIPYSSKFRLFSFDDQALKKPRDHHKIRSSNG